MRVAFRLRCSSRRIPGHRLPTATELPNSAAGSSPSIGSGGRAQDRTAERGQSDALLRRRQGRGDGGGKRASDGPIHWTEPSICPGWMRCRTDIVLACGVAAPPAGTASDSACCASARRCCDRHRRKSPLTPIPPTRSRWRVECQSATKHVHSANSSTDHRITGTAVVRRIAAIGHVGVNRVARLQAKEAAPLHRRIKIRGGQRGPGRPNALAVLAF